MIIGEICGKSSRGGKIGVPNVAVVAVVAVENGRILSHLQRLVSC
jgi:hypothetical protein